jgi:hypothetical protein
MATDDIREGSLPQNLVMDLGTIIEHRRWILGGDFNIILSLE